MKKFYRSSRDKKLLGLCGGLSETFNVDATLLRILLVVVTVITSGMVIFIYIIAGLVVPKEPPIIGGFGPNGPHGPYGGGNGGSGGFFGGGAGGYGHQQGTKPGQYSDSFGQYNGNPNAAQNQWDPRFNNQEPTPNSQFDSMMDDLEKKALRREIEELKAKIAKQEKGE
ncbi:PspC domain-containing protein [Paenibacillus sp. GSMTC-2017]|uniref:PspC domain-containing protein n=1 Tax=Paenibacillus sp. GSMTC-2017 TaxID=2794350 RepID=UPI0018D92DEC|nr:PspC domain-containing protein [Paenibacillus sp. GSMTC-2017]MBH5317566.1 PspC domain-containing protein [Paenibacillus sp. GSMTC-2017]